MKATSHASIKTAHELLTILEALAEDAYRTGEPELAFCLAACAGAYARGLISDIGLVLENVIGKDARAGILARIADEAARSNAGKN